MAVTTLFTNAPESYDYPYIVKAGVVDGCRVLDCPTKNVEHQTGRNSSGLYWTTSDIEKAAYLRRWYPYKEEENSEGFVTEL
jgi:hypothetical protein|tara:strand:- start:31 stop:276 length:246 start_codon:yes stop_codon:yes gene_type:complete